MMIKLSLLEACLENYFIISCIPKRGHDNVVISTKSLFRIISNSNTLKNLSKDISKLVFLDF